MNRLERKRRGAYYTPRWLADDVARRALLALWESDTASGPGARGLKPPGFPAITIVDPACGAGDFLLAALDRLAVPATGAPIARQCLYGVDLDPAAVAAARATLAARAGLHPDDLTNIRHGDSLIADPVYAGEAAFDWRAAFPAIFADKPGGFDVVIGNPPWGAALDAALPYLRRAYPASSREHTDSFKPFVELALRLARPGGVVALVAPSALLRQPRLRDVRALLLDYALLEVVDLGEGVFPGATVPACVFVARKIAGRADGSPELAAGLIDVSHLPGSAAKAAALDGGSPAVRVPLLSFCQNPDLALCPPLPDVNGAPSVPLGSVPDLRLADAGINYQRVGVGRQAKGQGDLARRLFYEGAQQRPQDQMYWKGADLDRYRIAAQTGRWCRPDYAAFLHEGEVVRLNEAVFDAAPKILLRQTADRIRAAIDYCGVWFGRSVLCILPQEGGPARPEYYLGLLNSAYLTRFYRLIAGETGRTFAQVKLASLGQLPIRLINFNDPADTARHDRMVALVAQMQQAASAGDTAAAGELDAAIDALVSELYGLPDAQDAPPP